MNRRKFVKRKNSLFSIADVHKSLELLEEYHADLFRSADSELKFAIEKLIALFKMNLFNALCDIQEFYDNVLLNERLPAAEKINETLRFVRRWETRPPLLSTGRERLLPPHIGLIGAAAASGGVGSGGEWSLLIWRLKNPLALRGE